eukprot:TRINITY_DN64309_c0_g1_i1.p1 TRINITY_DN64309_c0_g1~~TRINITY_DN64309_c0_g1_i1.p1  ORF type:complete len:834 (+),score=198.48 TRINITY_DN64309_c0_g1_i1:171-2672(+)
MPFGVICTQVGVLLPLFPGEESWPNVLRCILYLMGLGYIFLGVAIISDVFMAAIEKITSLKKTVVSKATGRSITITVWNGTVANLTLMALGSSAPEILLSVIEILTDNFYIGKLGVGTIVGSAAFNLLVISAVCVSSIPTNEVRYIKEVPVYVITASCSVFAYIWLFFILAVWTPDVCTIAEAIITFLMFPVLVVLAYFADLGYFSRKSTEEERSSLTRGQVLSIESSKEELAQLAEQIREEHGVPLTDEQVMKIMEASYFGNRSRAHYRHAGMGKGVGGRRISGLAALGPPDMQVSPALTTADVVEYDARTVVMGFKFPQYAFIESVGEARVVVVRYGPKDVEAKVKYVTRDGTALDGSDYTKVEGEIVFGIDETEKEIKIPILDDDAHEDNENFLIDLSEPEVLHGPHSKGIQTKLSEVPSVTVVIIDDDDPGSLRFEQEQVQVEESKQDQTLEIVVERVNGAAGVVGCSYHTESGSAIAQYDFEEATGTIEFDPTVQKVMIPVTIKAKGRYAREDQFRLYLTNPTGSASFDKETDGGSEQCICTITIKPGSTNKAIVDKITSSINWSSMALGHTNWKSQFYDAVILSPDEDDEDGELSKFDYALHFVSLPWKLLFALTPPVDYCGGWACFIVSLIFIGGVTMVVGDMANLVGCTLGIDAEITAITFVALGTSLPDTFASKAAASMDPYADASIGNVTGSNSVNVFLGLGMPWTIASIYWAATGATQDWKDKLAVGGRFYDVRESVATALAGADPNAAVFIVPAGTLWFNLTVFSSCALVAIAFLAYRRRTYSGELGGPTKACYVGSGFLTSLWFLYVALSSWWVVRNRTA